MSLEDILENLTKDLLEELLEGNNITYKKSLPKAKLAAFITAKAEKKGTDLFFVALEKESVRAALTDLEKEPEHENKSKMLKEFKDLWKSQGLQEILESLSVDTLKLLCEDLCFEVESDKPEDFVEQISDEIDILGIKKFFGVMAKAYLEDCCDSLKIKSSGSKKVLADRILASAYPHLSEEEKKKGKKEKKAKASTEADFSIIKDGITEDELFQKFYHGQLKQWCKDNDLKVSGKRKDVCQRIIAFLGGDEENTKAGAKPKKRKRKKAMSEATKKKRRKLKLQEKKEQEAEDGKNKVKAAPKKRGRKPKKK